VVEYGSGSCSVADFGVDIAKPLGYISRELVGLTWPFCCSFICSRYLTVDLYL